jgi:hypothetical protein
MRAENAPVIFKPHPAGLRTGNLFNERDKRMVISRIISLSPDQKPRWGKMNLPQMLDHCALALESALVAGAENISTQPCAELEYVSKLWRCSTLGYRIDEMERKMTALVNFVKHFDRANMSKGAYPFLGDMIYKEFGEIHFLHLDHHLNQFGK